MEQASIVIGLSAVVVAVRDGDAVVLTVRREGQLASLPFGPFDPDAHRTFELALRAFVTAQTRFDLGYVEQLYTFGDRGRHARSAVGVGSLPRGIPVEIEIVVEVNAAPARGSRAAAVRKSAAKAKRQMARGKTAKAKRR